MNYLPIILAVVIALAALVAVLRQISACSGSRREEQRRRAMAEFASHRDVLAHSFLAAAAATGKPRGLRWKAVELGGSPVFALDGAGRLFALVAATISFEAVVGGGMEDVEAVGNLRSATAVFVHRGGAWTSDGRVIFNLEPREAIERFDATLQPLI